MPSDQLFSQWLLDQTGRMLGFVRPRQLGWTGLAGGPAHPKRSLARQDGDFSHTAQKLGWRPVLEKVHAAPLKGFSSASPSEPELSLLSAELSLTSVQPPKEGTEATSKHVPHSALEAFCLLQRSAERRLLATAPSAVHVPPSRL